MREQNIERYWLTFALDTMTLRVIIPPHVWQAVRPYIGEEISRDAHAAGNTMLSYKLTPQDEDDICAKLNDIFNALADIETTNAPSARVQLLEIFGLISSADGYRGCSIDIETSLPFRQWVAGQDTDLALVTRNVIASTYCHLNPKISRQDIDVSACLGGNDLRLRTFGDCACLGYDGSDKDRLHENSGFPLVSHNINSTQQFLSLLAAVAYLWGLARQELYD